MASGNYIYTFRYAGSKYGFLNIILGIMLGITNRSILIEPYGGSGVVSANASKHFSKVILNDLCHELMAIHKMFKESTWDDHVSFEAKHPDMNYLQKKHLFYKFRDETNDAYFGSNSIQEGISMYYLVGACINSMFRIGPNGFNQSAANQNLSKKMNPFLLRNYNRVYSNIELRNQDAFVLFDEFRDNPDATWFIDPPYNNTTLNYGINCPKMKLIETICELRGNVIYTDSYNEVQDEILKKHGFLSRVIRVNMPNISVGGKGEQYTNRKEMLYFRKSLQNPIS